jgi:hypothetical protein
VGLATAQTTAEPITNCLKHCQIVGELWQNISPLPLLALAGFCWLSQVQTAQNKHPVISRGETQSVYTTNRFPSLGICAEVLGFRRNEHPRFYSLHLRRLNIWLQQAGADSVTSVALNINGPNVPWNRLFRNIVHPVKGGLLALCTLSTLSFASQNFDNATVDCGLEIWGVFPHCNTLHSSPGICSTFSSFLSNQPIGSSWSMNFAYLLSWV